MLSSPSSPHTTTISPDSTAPPPLAASPTLDSLTPVLVCPQLVRHKASNCPGAYVRNPSASQLHSRFCALVLLHLSLVHAAAKSYLALHVLDLQTCFLHPLLLSPRTASPPSRKALSICMSSAH
ncbi:hypothetical protein GGP41_002410 [Bipolaris sorokiniana]|uniref:Uncharacterized protein n=1 Tax=Cochliobolus sativus TaxID=45130 RepID=A0A8H6DW68_COCSA|nr:hypothetical protein GGP41_002410 [Bipolaris sorokiniana]